MTNHLTHACLFCQFAEGEIGLVYVRRDKYPVTPGHSLIIPTSHRADWYDMTIDERDATVAELDRLRDELAAADPSIVGYNIGMNAGLAAGQTVMHAHTHLIPRRHGDMDDPAGGVRGVIPCQQKYTRTDPPPDQQEHTTP